MGGMRPGQYFILSVFFTNLLTLFRGPRVFWTPASASAADGAAPVRVSLDEGALDIPGCSPKVIPVSEYPAALVGVAPILKRVEVTSRDP